MNRRPERLGDLLPGVLAQLVATRTAVNGEPPMSTRPERIGHCSLCRCAVFRRGQNGAEKLSNRSPHSHRKPYTIIPESEDDTGEIRDWELASGAWRYS